MPSKPFAALPPPTALGATLLGLSATLFAVDVAGTMLLDTDRAGTIVAQRVVPATAFQAEHNPQTVAATAAPAAPAAAAEPRVFAPQNYSHKPLAQVNRSQVNPPHVHTWHALTRNADSPHAARPQARPAMPPNASAVLAQHANAPQATQRGGKQAAKRPAAAAARAIVAARGGDASGPHRVARVAHTVATLRDVRRFVIRDLQGKDTRLSVISATTYAAGNGRVIVDMVLRDDKGRWLEKAVVRRRDGAVKLIGTKQRALPYERLASASTGVAPGP